MAIKFSYPILNYEARRRRAFILIHEWEKANPSVSLQWILATGRAPVNDEWAVMRFLGARTFGDAIDALGLGDQIQRSVDRCGESEESLTKKNWLSEPLVKQAKKLLAVNTLQRWAKQGQRCNVKCGV